MNEETGVVAKCGDWVQIRWTLLSPEERAPTLPEDTKAIPFEARVKGFLLSKSGRLNERVVVRSILNSEFEGVLEAINPRFEHDFGRAVPELLNVGSELRCIIQREQVPK